MQASDTGNPFKWYIMAAVASGVFLATIDGSIVNVALPVLERELGTVFAVVQWVVLAYLLVVTTLMLSIGRLADMIGKKPIYLAGMIVFTIGSTLCGISSSIGMLIGFRVLQAVGAAMVMALGTAIITEAFPARERGKAMGLTGLMVSLGAISGPTLGGLLLGVFTWHAIFFVNIPIGIIGCLLVLRFVPATRPVGGQRFDFLGAGTLLVGMLSLLLGLTVGQNAGFGTPPVVAMLAGGLIFLGVFIWIERKAREPMIDLGMFRNQMFSVNLITGFLTFVGSAGTVVLMPFFLQNIMNYSPETAGMLLAIVPLSMGIVAPLSGSLSDRFGSRRLTAIGLFVLLVGYVAVSTLNANIQPVGYVLRFLPIGIGMGLFQSPNNSAVMGASPRHRLGIASGLLSLTRTIGQTTGIAVMSAIWASQVRVMSGMGTTVDTTSAPIAIQVVALNRTTLVIVVLIAIALLMSIWALIKDTQGRAVEANSVVDQ